MKNLTKIVLSAVVLLTIGVFSANFTSSANNETSNNLDSQVSNVLFASKAFDSKCGEGKSAVKDTKETEKAVHKCGEGKCGEGKSETKDAKATKDVKAESKCGEGKCGEGNSAEKAATKTEKSEDKCGEGKCGEGK